LNYFGGFCIIHIHIEERGGEGKERLHQKSTQCHREEKERRNKIESEAKSWRRGDDIPSVNRPEE
jgi:Ni/Co efflux regulator RcnB